MSTRKRIIITSEIDVVELDGELVILDIDNGHYYGLNRTGARILEMAHRNPTVDDVVSDILNNYNVDPELLQADVERFLREMKRCGLLSVEDIAMV